ncbi:MAG: ATP-binding cassette domain-containing protein [Rudaea sp.]|nr:ATP-binding cassette domain-containing protein [Rudaea sp.]MBR0347245.1 ATP-binding cassette domain-containing protein [Rudaea sp.]
MSGYYALPLLHSASIVTHADSASPPLLELHDARLVRGGNEILHGLSLRIEPGQHTAIVGPNGAGKSSLVRMIHRDDYPLAHDDGTPPMRILGRTRWDVFELRKHLGIVSGDLQQRLTGEDLVDGLDAVISGFFASHVLSFNHEVTDAMREAANTALERLGATRLAHRRFSTLSTGEARRVLIARALVHDPGAVLLDEPTAGLDFVAQRTLLESLRGLAHGGTTLVLVTHHLEEILPEIDHVILLREGQVFAQGSKAEVLRSEVLSAQYGVPIRVRSNGSYFHAEFDETDSGG